VPVKLIIYKGFGGIGHGRASPRQPAVMEHNLEWFDQYLFDARLDRRPSRAPLRGAGRRS
jgi:hypothetical protein